MKTKFFSMMALAAMLLGTSCSNDELSEPANGQPMTANFSVELPTGISARKAANGAKKVFADGKTATKLKYMVFDKDGNRIEGLGGEKDINLTANVQMQLTTGKEYKIVFWAANANAPYTLDDNGVVTVDYTSIKANDESLDAFYRCYDYKAGENVENPIKLYRPFAQLNVGTNDLEAAAKAGFNKAAAQTEVKVSGIANKLNLLDGSVDGDAVVTYKLNAIPEGETFPKAGYDYLSMDYLLVGKDKSNVDVNWQITDGANTINRTFANVPVQGNYRTNIYGALLTSTTDFNVQIEPAFNTPDYEYTVQTAEELKEALNADGDVKISLTGNVSLKELLGSDTQKNPYTLQIRNKNVTIDLNNNVLESVADIRIMGGNVTISNGVINETGGDNTVGLRIGEGCDVTLDHVNVIASKAQSALYIQDAKSKVVAKNCKLKGLFYGVGTNAAMPEALTNTVEMTFENCEVYGQAALFINVPGKLTATNTKAYGYWQGLVVRGGTAVINGCEIYQAFDANYDVEGSKGNHRTPAVAATQYMTEDWGGGNEIPMAAIVLGTHNTGAYQYPTNLEMKGTKVVGNAPFRAVVERNSGKNVVSYTDGGNNTITGAWLKYNASTGKYDEVNK